MNATENKSQIALVGNLIFAACIIFLAVFVFSILKGNNKPSYNEPITTMTGAFTKFKSYMNFESNEIELLKYNFLDDFDSNGSSKYLEAIKLSQTEYFSKDFLKDGHLNYREAGMIKDEAYRRQRASKGLDPVLTTKIEEQSKALIEIAKPTKYDTAYISNN